MRSIMVEGSLPKALPKESLSVTPAARHLLVPERIVRLGNVLPSRDKAAVHSLPVFLRLQAAAVILVGEGAMADAKRRLIERGGARVVGEEAEDARLAFVALADGAEEAAARLKARGLLVNVADRPELCDFTLPAIVDRDPVIVAIGTGGVSAGLAAALRQRLEALLPATLGSLATALHHARPSLAARFPDGDARRRAIASLLAPGAALDPLGSANDVETALAAAETAPPRIERIAIASPDPDELTLRAARLLGSADRLYHPADLTPAILDRARADAVRIIGSAPALPPPGLSLELVWMRA